MNKIIEAIWTAILRDDTDYCSIWTYLLPFNKAAALLDAALDAGVSFVASNNYGDSSLLHLIVERPALWRFVPRLLAAGCDPNAKTAKSKCPVVHFACSMGDLELVQTLVAAGGVLGDHCECSGKFTSALHATESRRKDKWRLLEWLATRPEIDWWDQCLGKTSMLVVRNWYADDPRCVKIVDGAMAAQRRWTPARAAWMAAVVT